MLSFLKRTGNSRGHSRKLKGLVSRILSSKRQKFIVSVIILSLGLFSAEYVLGKAAIPIVFILAILTSVFLYLGLKDDLEDNFNWQVFVLPFLYSFSIGLFYLLVPARLITRVGITSLYALGLYSLFLSQNIFTVSAIRTIALLSGARTVSLVLTILSYFFLSNVVLSFHINIFVTLLLISVYSFLFVLQAVWVYTLDKNFFSEIFWVLSLTFCLAEVALFLWFIPGSPTVLALFLTAIFYVLIGLTQAWFEKRLFRGVILEYFWVTVVSFIFLVLFTNIG
jgi:hypothetical protein